MRFGLEEKTIALINGVFAKYPQVEKAILYGSRAKGNYKKGSDIDITLMGAGLDLSIIILILNDLDDLMLPFMFDISIYDQIRNVDLIDHIERVGQMIYEAGSSGNMVAENRDSSG